MDRDLGERVAVLETEWTSAKEDLKAISAKLDSLLHLKAKGMGAIQLIGLIFGSGIVGLILTVTSFFSGKSHL